MPSLAKMVRNIGTVQSEASFDRTRRPLPVVGGDTKEAPSAAGNPGGGYRRNVWVEYASLADAAVARALLSRDRPDEALLALERAVSINPFDPDVHRAFADAWTALGDPTRAAQARDHLVDRPHPTGHLLAEA